MDQNHFRANGKLLLSGEYFILDGAKGLALPTKYGQTLTAESSEQEGIFWKSLDHENKIWFEARFSSSLEIISSANNEIAKTLQNILQHCELPTTNCQFISKLEFPQNWGLGSSSTLVSLLSQYCSSDPYLLLAETFGGSGYDIACATSKGAITFQTSGLRSPITNTIAFHPPFTENLYFAHLGRKKNSREGIKHYKSLTLDKSLYIEEITMLTDKLIAANELDEFCYYLEVHENIISKALQLPKVKEINFPDFPGTVKSLGAWGGDFVMVASDESPNMISSYFLQKGLSTFLPYDTMIL